MKAWQSPSNAVDGHAPLKLWLDLSFFRRLYVCTRVRRAPLTNPEPPVPNRSRIESNHLCGRPDSMETAQGSTGLTCIGTEDHASAFEGSTCRSEKRQMRVGPK